MTNPANANPSLGPVLPGYDPTGHQTDVALQVGTPIQDATTGVWYAPLLSTVSNANANGQTTMSASAPVVIASNQTPVATEQQPAWAALLGQSYTATTGVIVTGGAGSSGLCLFNNSTAKNIIIYSITAFDQTATQQVLLAKVAADPVLNTALPQINDNFNGAASALAGHCTFSSTVFTLPSRTQYKSIQVPTNQDTREVLTNGQVVILPANVASGLLVYMTVGATNSIGFNAQWWEQ